MAETKWPTGTWTKRAEDLRGGRYWVLDIPGLDETVDIHEGNYGEALVSLFYAAPDLYEALDELRVLMDAVAEGDYQPDSFTTQPARIALAKARGE